MPRRATARQLVSTLALVAGCALPLYAQLPATSPTSMPAPISATSTPGPVATKPHRPTVTYAAGLLDVRANDSSLNSILREIARLTGMTITGGVADQRVFGNYGPAEPSVVLATLLDGTGTNLLLRESADNAPAELQLTPRTPGGPTPPSPNSAQFNDSDDNTVSPPPQQQPGSFVQGFQPRTGPGYSQTPAPATAQAPPLPISGTGPNPVSSAPGNNMLGSPSTASPSAATLPVTNSVPVDAIGTPSTAQPVSGIVDSPSGPPAGSTTAGFNAAANANAASPTTPTNDADTSGSNTPGGSTAPAARTPEQIFEQLQQLRRAAQAQSGTAASPTTTQPASSTPK